MATFFSFYDYGAQLYCFTLFQPQMSGIVGGRFAKVTIIPFICSRTAF